MTYPAPDPGNLGAYHRYICEVLQSDGTPSMVLISGDLHHERRIAVAQLVDWVEAGVCGIVDCRGEYSDESLVAHEFPQLTYIYVGVDDDGGTQSDEWFDAGVDAALEIINRSERVMVHCHMGINRGPSMAFAILLARGMGVSEALTAILNARPIVGIIYAESAIEWFGRRNDWTLDQVADAQAELAAWREQHGINRDHVVRMIRSVASQ
ncbi:MAG: dual specificity protein phosphatase family protein [Actinomycetes bacterium]